MTMLADDRMEEETSEAYWVEPAELAAGLTIELNWLDADGPEEETSEEPQTHRQLLPRLRARSPAPST